HTRFDCDWSSDVCSSDLALAVLQELDVVDQQDVDVAVAPLERLGLVVAQAVDEVVGEFLGGHVANGARVTEGGGVMADRMQQVRSEERRVGKEGRCGGGG